MGVTGTSSGGRVMGLDTLIRARRTPRTGCTARRLPVPDGMTLPMGCDAVALPAHIGPLVLPRLPRVGCVYADDTHWWWMVPSDSDYAMEWPAPARYAAGAVLPDTPGAIPGLIHKPDGIVPYTPPIPLYLAVCQVTGTLPVWSRKVTA
jgi:hypothetical protein